MEWFWLEAREQPVLSRSSMVFSHRLAPSAFGELAHLVRMKSCSFEMSRSADRAMPMRFELLELPVLPPHLLLELLGFQLEHCVLQPDAEDLPQRGRRGVGRGPDRGVLHALGSGFARREMITAGEITDSGRPAACPRSPSSASRM